ncbi:FecR domain-containing protein, partial [Pseudomonas aeruginosa]|uniref:FecR domain-containing protein n=1 Tax=Pseudomonas aeruginosa TaxID=287 RepID=UPI002883965B
LFRSLRGEIFVDSRADPRPFRVATAEARLHAGAARFNVRQEMAATRGAVLAGRGELSPLHRRGRGLESGEAVGRGADC